MVDEPSDACSRTDGDGVRVGRNNKRKSSRACSYPNKKVGFLIRIIKERFVMRVLTVAVIMVMYLFTKYDNEEESGEEEVQVEEEDWEEEEEEGEKEDDDEGEEEEEEEEEEEDDEEEHAELLEATVDFLITTKAWAERELGPGNRNIVEILGTLRFIPGYGEALKARQKAVKAE